MKHPRFHPLALAFVMTFAALIPAPASSYPVDVKVISSSNPLNTILEVDVAAQGTAAAAISEDGYLYIISSTGASHRVSIGEDTMPTALAISSDGTRILCGDSDGNTHLYDSSGNEILDPYLPFFDSMVYSADISSDGSVGVVSTDLRVIYFNLEGSYISYEWSSVYFSQCSVDISSDGEHVLVYDDEKLNVLNSEGDYLWEDDWTPEGNGKIVYADLSENGERIGVLTDNRLLYFISTLSGGVIWKVERFGQTDQIYEGIVELSADGSVIMAAHDYGPNLESMVYIYHRDSSAVVTSFTGASILATRLSGDGKYIILQCSNRTGEDLKLIELEESEVMWCRHIDGYVGSVYNLAISADGCFVAYGSSLQNFSFLSTIPRTTLTYSGAVERSGVLYFSQDGTIQLSSRFIGERATTYWSMDGGDYREYRGAIALSGYGDGAHTLSYYTVDSHGNREETKAFSFTIDNIPPTLTISSPQNNIWVASEVTILWNATDAGCGVDHYSIEVDGELVAENLPNTTYTVRDLAEGVHVITLHAFDKLGNEAEEDVNVKVDPNPPVLTLQPDVTVEYINEENYTLQWSSTDELSGINHFEVSVDERNKVSLSADQNRYTLLGLKEGEHHVKIVAVDNAGNSIEKSLVLVVDLHRPSVNFLSSQPQYIGPSHLPFPLSWEARDEMTGVKRTVVEIKCAENGSILERREMGNETTYHIKNLTEGMIEVSVTVYDLAGNKVTTSFSFVYDATPPNITFSYKYDSNDLYVKVRGSDEHSGIAYYYIYYEINGGDGEWEIMEMRQEGGESVGEYTIYGLSSGDYDIYIKAVDRAGNEREEKYTVHISFVEANVFLLGVCLPTLVILALVLFLIVRRVMKKRSPPEKAGDERTPEITTGSLSTVSQPSPPAHEELSLEEKIKETKKLRRRAYRHAQRLIEKGMDVSDVMGVLATASQAEKRGDIDLSYRAVTQAIEMLKSKYDGPEE